MCVHPKVGSVHAAEIGLTTEVVGCLAAGEFAFVKRTRLKLSYPAKLSFGLRLVESEMKNKNHFNELAIVKF